MISMRCRVSSTSIRAHKCSRTIGSLTHRRNLMHFGRIDRSPQAARRDPPCVTRTSKVQRRYRSPAASRVIRPVARSDAGKIGPPSSGTSIGLRLAKQGVQMS